MRNLRVNRRADDMPLYGLIIRLGRGKYQVVIKAKASKRIVDIDFILLPSKPAVKQFYARMYPTLTWGEPKYSKPKLVIPKRPKKVTHKVTKRKKGKRNAVPRAVRLRH